MALSDLSVFSEYVRTAATEVIAQQIELFNGATRGAIVLQPGDHVGDYSDELMFAKIAGLVKRRNAYGAGAVSGKKLTNITDTMVKVAAGTPPVEMNPGQFRWIQQNPAVAGAAMGQQLAGDMLADMLNTGVSACDVALAQIALLKNDISGGSGAAALASAAAFNTTAGLFGDRNREIAVWVMHSKPMVDFYGAGLTGSNFLFRYETVNVVADPFGRIFVVTDAPGLFKAGSPNKYHSLGLVPGAIRVDQNNDFDDNLITVNGDENLLRTYQAEWSYNLGVKGFQWDKTNGGKSPTDAAITTATNWDQYVTSLKDTAGVVLVTQ